MERLWAPWRLSYVTGERPEGCVFCNHLKQSDEDALIVHRGERSYVVLNLYPFGSGHLMIVPSRHVAAPRRSRTPRSAPSSGSCSTARSRRSRRHSEPQGHNVGFNLGAAAGAGIADHLHLHVVPRWSGDYNFMPVLADVRVMPQYLAETRAALVAAWPADGAPPYHWAHDAGSFGLQGLRRPRHRPGRARRRRRVPHRPRVRRRVRAAARWRSAATCG